MRGKTGFSDIYHAFKKGVNLILILTIFAVGAMGFLNEFVIDPVYQSTVQILVNSNGDATSSEADTNDTQTSSQLIEACSEIIESPEILDEVVKVLEQKGISTTVTELQNAINVTSESDKQVMNVTVEGDNPSTTAVTANTTAEVFQEKVVDIIPVENVTILSTAAFGELVKPNTLKNTVLAGGIGLLIGIVIVFIRGVRDTTIKKEETITEMFGVTVLGTTTDFELVRGNHKKKTTKLATNKSKREKRRLFPVEEPKSIISEQYRILKTSTDCLPLDRKLRKMMVTSSNPAEGKSTTIANLAILYAREGKRVLLVDADLRKPTVHNTFSLSNTVGLSNLLTNSASLIDAFQKTDVEKLFVVTSGPIPTNPTDLLGSKAMDQFLDKATEFFDMVIFDAPPILPVTDPIVLSKKCDGVVLVVKSGSTKREDFKKAKEGLEKAQANILGAVLTGCDNKEDQYYYYE